MLGTKNKSAARHIRKDFHYIKEEINEFKTLLPEKVGTNDNLSDVLTKTMGRVKHRPMCIKLMNMHKDWTYDNNRDKCGHVSQVFIGYDETN